MSRTGGSMDCWAKDDAEEKLLAPRCPATCGPAAGIMVDWLRKDGLPGSLVYTVQTILHGIGDVSS